MCDLFMIEKKLLHWCIFENLFFFCSSLANHEIKALNIIIYYFVWLKVTGSQILCVHISLGNPDLWEQKYYYNL